jgi:hypothetical protein
MNMIYSLMIFIVISTLVGCTPLGEKSELSELQVTACNTADDGGTCDTKLPELELVTTGQCCEILGKCC